MKAFISRRDFLKAAGITAAAAALAGCSSSGGSASGSSAGGKTIKIGVFEPASGDNGAGGKQEVLGVEYANSLAPTVAIGGETYNVELVEVDNQSSTDKAVTAAQELVSKKVSIVLGSYGSSVSIAAAPTFQSASIPAIGCSCTNPAVTEANPYYFRVCFLDPFQGSVMANFAKDEFSAANAYVLSMLGEDYGSGLATYFVNAFEDLGGTVTSEQFPEGTSDFSAYIQNAINAGADVIFAPCATTYAAQIITQAASAGFDKPITAGDTWESSVILDAQKGTSVQVYCSTFFDENDDSGAAKEFVTGFKEWLNADSQKLTNNGGNDIVAAVSALGYDGYMVALEAIKAAGSTDGTAIRDALYGVNYDGVTGNITFDQTTGDANKDMAYIKKAATIILVCNCVVQLMQTFNWHFQVVAEGAEDTSILATIASPFAVLLIPLGFGAWQLAAAAITGFIAKENVVGTLAVVYSITNFIDTDELALTGGANEVAMAMGLTSVTALAYLMFNLYTPPCFAAIGAMNSEMKSAKWLWAAIGLQLGTGYTVAFLVYHIGSVITGAGIGNGFVPGLIAILCMVAIVIFIAKRSRKEFDEEYELHSKGTGATA